MCVLLPHANSLGAETASRLLGSKKGAGRTPVRAAAFPGAIARRAFAATQYLGFGAAGDKGAAFARPPFNKPDGIHVAKRRSVRPRSISARV